MVQKISLEKEIDFLNLLEEGEIITQLTLSQTLSISIGMVNALLKRAMHKGYVKAKAAPYKRFAYYITPKGFQEKSRLVSEYLQSSLSFFRIAKRDYVDMFERAKANGIDKFIFVDSGELSEIAYLASIETEVNIIGTIEGSSSTANIPLLNNLDNIQGQVILVVTTSKEPQLFYEFIKAKYDGYDIIYPRLLNIRTNTNFKVPTVQTLQEKKRQKNEKMVCCKHKTTSRTKRFR